jgi:hypothetical protein
VALEGHNITVSVEIDTFEKNKISGFLREKLISY